MKGVISVSIAAFSLLLPEVAAAQGVCVDCQGPDRSYRCTVKDGERAQQFRGGQRALEFLCMSEMARVGSHESCRVNTSYAGPCIGQPLEIDLAKIGSGINPAGAAQGEHAEGEEAGPAPARSNAAKNGPPQTLEQLARETVSKSKAQISAADENVKKAGDAVGGAVKKTWDCIASLFNRC